MTIQEDIKRLIYNRDKAHSEWINGVKSYMSDGKERPVKDELNEDELDSVIVHFKHYGYCIATTVDKVKYDKENNEFMLHIVAVDDEDCDRWLSSNEIEETDLEEVLELIVW